MALAQPKVQFTEEDYLRFDAESEEKHEFVNGELVAMAGVSPAHDAVQVNLTIAFGTRLRGSSCRVHGADLRVRITETGLYAYPDLTIVCGEPQFTTTKPPSLLNPRVVIEVLSPSTASYDLGPKAAHYRHRDSVQTILFIDSRRPYVQRQDRAEGGGWHLHEQTDGEIQLLGHTLSLAEIYEAVELETAVEIDEEPVA